MDESSDHVARVAAFQLISGDAQTVREAIEQAQIRTQSGRLPSHSSVRKHHEFMQQEAMGLKEWHKRRLNRLEALETVLQTILYAVPEARVFVTGRAAEGHVDQTGPASIRVLCDEPMDVIIDVLESHGLGPMEVSSVRTQFGRCGTAMHHEESLWIRLIFLPNRSESQLKFNVIDGSAVSVVDVLGFTALVEQARIQAVA